MCNVKQFFPEEVGKEKNTCPEIIKNGVCECILPLTIMHLCDKIYDI